MYIMNREKVAAARAKAKEFFDKGTSMWARDELIEERPMAPPEDKVYFMKPSWSLEGIELVEKLVAMPSAEDLLVAYAVKEIQHEHMNLWVESWHKGCSDQTLQDFMGFTTEEYSAWALDSEAIPPQVIDNLNKWLHTISKRPL